MLRSVYRFMSPCRSYATASTRIYKQNAPTSDKHINEQNDYLRSVLENNNQDWTSVKNNILAKWGNLNTKNIDSVMLRVMVASKNIDTALSFADHLTSSTQELSLGVINSLLNLYTEMGKTKDLSKENKQFILNTYNYLYDKYKVLESTTCERLLHALCAINEWEKALKVLEDIYLSSTPTHSAYSTLIATFFKLNKKKKALDMIKESIKNKRLLQDNAYEAWINYILKKYKDKKTISKYMDEIFDHIARNCAVVSVDIANRLKEVYHSLDWEADFARIRKIDGQCSCCKETLNCLALSNEEFDLLQQNVKDKLILGSDLFLKSSPEELERFSNFVKKTAPYDIVLDGLNIAYAIRMGTHMDKLKLLNKVIDYFVGQNKKVLVLGREHMLRWNRQIMQRIMNKTCTFLAQDLSQDDPYFITAAILSGPNTDLMSKDLLRGHNFKLQDENLKFLFKRWQWQHQWMMFLGGHKGLTIQPPLKFTPCAQKKDNTWHLPYESASPAEHSQINDGIPDLKNWLCLTNKK